MKTTINKASWDAVREQIEAACDLDAEITHVSINYEIKAGKSANYYHLKLKNQL